MSDETGLRYPGRRFEAKDSSGQLVRLTPVYLLERLPPAHLPVRAFGPEYLVGLETSAGEPVVRVRKGRYRVVGERRILISDDSDAV